MLFDKLLNSNRNFFWTLFHVALAIICTVTPFPFIIWFYIILLSSLFKAISYFQRGSSFMYFALLCYLVSFEMLGRMAKVAPFIPTELGKYFLIFFSLLGILLVGIKSTGGLVLIFLLVPSLFIDLSGERAFFDIVYNFFGPLGLALGVTLFYRAKVSSDDVSELLRLLWLTSLSALVFTFIKTPELDSIEFDLSAQFSTTADMSSNQVATILGLGMFLSFYSVINRKKFSGYHLIDIGIMLLFAFQGLLSFSRGGMLVAILGMAILLIYRKSKSIQRNKSKVMLTVLASIMGVFFVFKVVNNITGGNLLLRYSGETEGTIRGAREKSTDVLVSGRLSILQEDLSLWLENPILGVGAASSRYMRDRTYLVSPHVEFSRLLAEHGIPGLVFFIMLFTLFISSYRKLNSSFSKEINLALFVIAILSTFHAAMRTYVTPVLFVMSVLNVYPVNNVKSQK